MKKEEFLQGLGEALAGEMPTETMKENLRYYEDYIRTEQGRGRTEEEIMEELGSPRLIARTIIDATPGAGDGSYGSRETASESYAKSGRDESYQNSGGVRYYDLNKWYWKLLGIVLVVLMITVVLMIVGGILSLVLPLLPVIGLVILIMWFVRGGSGPGR